MIRRPLGVFTTNPEPPDRLTVSHRHGESHEGSWLKVNI
jgi:hypothetical protein